MLKALLGRASQSAKQESYATRLLFRMLPRCGSTPKISAACFGFLMPFRTRPNWSSGPRNVLHMTMSLAELLGPCKDVGIRAKSLSENETLASNLSQLSPNVSSPCQTVPAMMPRFVLSNAHNCARGGKWSYAGKDNFHEGCWDGHLGWACDRTRTCQIVKRPTCDLIRHENDASGASTIMLYFFYHFSYY